MSNLCSPDSAVKMTEPMPLIPKLDGASDARVKLGEELLLAGHVMGGSGVETPPVHLVSTRVVAEEGACPQLVKAEESRCGQCHWSRLMLACARSRAGSSCSACVM